MEGKIMVEERREKNGGEEWRGRMRGRLEGTNGRKERKGRMEEGRIEGDERLGKNVGGRTEGEEWRGNRGGVRSEGKEWMEKNGGAGRMERED